MLGDKKHEIHREKKTSNSCIEFHFCFIARSTHDCGRSKRSVWDYGRPSNLFGSTAYLCDLACAAKLVWVNSCLLLLLMSDFLLLPLATVRHSGYDLHLWWMVWLHKCVELPVLASRNTWWSNTVKCNLKNYIYSHWKLYSNSYRFRGFPNCTGQKATLATMHKWMNE